VRFLVFLLLLFSEQADSFPPLSAHKAGLVDYSRIALLRTASDFDRAPNSSVDAYTAFEAEQGGFEPAIQNLVIAGGPVVDDIVNNWDSIYQAGIEPQASLNGRYVDGFSSLLPALRDQDTDAFLNIATTATTSERSVKVRRRLVALAGASSPKFPPPTDFPSFKHILSSFLSSSYRLILPTLYQRCL
jgi:hypothetical protein